MYINNSDCFLFNMCIYMYLICIFIYVCRPISLEYPLCTTNMTNLTWEASKIYCDNQPLSQPAPVFPIQKKKYIL